MPLHRRQLLQWGATSAGILALPEARAVPHSHTGKPLHILILGGTGFMGPHQVRYALARGHKVTLFNRGRRPQDWPGEVEELTGDRETGDLRALEGRRFDVCIDNPTSVPHWVRDVGQILKDQVSHYLFISTISVYADNATPDTDESAPLAIYNGTDALQETRASLLADMTLYGPLKAACEAEAARWFPAITTVVRPGLIVGPGDDTDRFSYWPLRLRRGGEVLAPGDGRDPVQFIDVRDLAEWTIRLAEQRVYGTFNATGPGFDMGMDQMLYGIHAVLGTPVQFRWAPAAWLADAGIQPWSDLPVWVPGSGDSAGFARRSAARALAQGLRFRPLAQTVTDLLQWFDRLPAERRDTLRAGLSAAREATVLRALPAS